MKHLRYLRYILRHKWFVLLECRRLGVLRLGLLHDWSKFRPSEWFPYAEFFYGPKAKVIRDSTGYYKPANTGSESFDHAWFLHQKRNKHHWQWWVLAVEVGVDLRTGELDVKMMPPRYVREMVADWRGAGRAQGKPDTLAWYRSNGGKMVLHSITREFVENLLGLCLDGHIERCPRGQSCVCGVSK